MGTFNLSPEHAGIVGWYFRGDLDVLRLISPELKEQLFGSAKQQADNLASQVYRSIQADPLNHYSGKYNQNLPTEANKQAWLAMTCPQEHAKHLGRMQALVFTSSRDIAAETSEITAKWTRSLPHSYTSERLDEALRTLPRIYGINPIVTRGWTPNLQGRA